jgi:hypothetical protein
MLFSKKPTGESIRRGDYFGVVKNDYVTKRWRENQESSEIYPCSMA